MSILLHIEDYEDVIRSFYYPEKRKRKIKTLDCNDSSSAKIIDREVPECFLDCYKSNIKLWNIMGGIIKNKEGMIPMPLYTKCRCWWDHHCFNTHPIGIPIAYHRNKNNEISENVKKCIKELNPNLDVSTTDYFETIGIFCSFPCARSYILHSDNIIFKDSAMLLGLMYMKFFGKIIDIPCAADYKILDVYGGDKDMTIDRFRKELGMFQYVETINIKRPYMFTCSKYIEERD